MKMINWLITLLRNLFGKPAIAESLLPTAPVVNLGRRSNVVRVHTVVKPVHRRPRLSALVDTVTLPEVKCRPLGKHRVQIDDDGSVQKVLGQIASNGVARVRPFGVPYSEHRMVRLAAA